MLVLPTVCASCGFMIGTVSLLFKFLLYTYPKQRRDTLRIGEGREMLLDEINKKCGNLCPCCFNQLQGVICYPDEGVPFDIITSEDEYIYRAVQA